MRAGEGASCEDACRSDDTPTPRRLGLGWRLQGGEAWRLQEGEAAGEATALGKPMPSKARVGAKATPAPREERDLTPAP